MDQKIISYNNSSLKYQLFSKLWLAKFHLKKEAISNMLFHLEPFFENN
jgi:hypothetical protein